MAARFYEETVTVNGRQYTLQHPGTSEWMKKRQELSKIRGDGTMTFDMHEVIVYGFEHVVIPEKGAKLNLKNWDPRDQSVLQEVWQPLLLNFLGGKKISRHYASSDWREENPQEWARLDRANLQDGSESGSAKEPEGGVQRRDEEPDHADADRGDSKDRHR